MEAYDLELIQVLWVEDDPEVRESYPIEAESKGLQLVSYPCWDEGKAALEREYDRWSAIILDAKCKPSIEDKDNAVRFLGEALKDIAVISKEKRRVIPWYVLTGGDESEVSDSITVDRMKWDADWTDIEKKKYYSKNKDRKKLWDRIREHAVKSPRFQMMEMYRDIYEKISKINKDACKIILDIFEVMHFPGDHPDFNPVLYYNQLRQILEWIFRYANRFGIIPDVLVNNIVNLNQCCCYLSGKRTLAIKPQLRYGEERENNDCDRIVPQYIENILFLILNLGNINSHTTTIDEKEQEKIESFFVSNVSSSRYLIFSLALQVCEVTLWLNNYIDNHQNIEENKSKCKVLDDIGQEEGNYHEGIIIEVENQHGNFLNVKCDLYQFPLQIKSKKGKLKKDDMVLFKLVQEPNKKDPNKQFLFAEDVHLKE